MNSLPTRPGNRLKTYFTAAVFLTPPIAVWVLCSVFGFPKLKQLWADAGFSDSTATGFMITSDFFLRHGILLFASVIILTAWVELRDVGWWKRHRGVIVGAAVFLLNTGVLVLMLIMMATAIAVAPHLSFQR